MTNAEFLEILPKVIDYFNNYSRYEGGSNEKERVLIQKNIFEGAARGSQIKDFVKKANIACLKEKHGFFKPVNITESSIIFTGLTKLIPLSPKLISDYSKLQRTHDNLNLNKIRQKASHLIYKQSIKTTPKLQTIDGKTPIDILNYEKGIIITENKYIFDQSAYEWERYLERHGLKDEGQYILYGSGTLSSNERRANFIKDFHKKQYFGDLDDKGFEIFLNLNKKLSALNVPRKDLAKFILPTVEFFLEATENKFSNSLESPKYIGQELKDYINENLNLNLKSQVEINQESFVIF